MAPKLQTIRNGLEWIGTDWNGMAWNGWGLGRSWGVCWRSWAVLGRKISKNMTNLKLSLFLEREERDLRPWGAVLGRSWGLCGWSWPLVGPMLAILGRSWGLCWRSWAVLGPLLAVLGRLVPKSGPNPSGKAENWAGAGPLRAGLAGACGMRADRAPSPFTDFFYGYILSLTCQPYFLKVCCNFCTPIANDPDFSESGEVAL